VKTKAADIAILETMKRKVVSPKFSSDEDEECDD
jgi:hypothetical protein